MQFNICIWSAVKIIQEKQNKLHTDMQWSYACDLQERSSRWSETSFIKICTTKLNTSSNYVTAIIRMSRATQRDKIYKVASGSSQMQVQFNIKCIDGHLCRSPIKQKNVTSSEYARFSTVSVIPGSECYRQGSYLSASRVCWTCWRPRTFYRQGSHCKAFTEKPTIRTHK